jgi:hypothetical protein
MMNSTNSTNFANGTKRAIRMGSRGGFFVVKPDGLKKYNPVAKFRKSTNGTLVKLYKANLPNVPLAIRPARVAAAAKASPLVRRPRLSPNSKVTKMFQDIMNRQVKPPRAKKASPLVRRRRLSPGSKATKLFQAILNRQVKPPRAKANKANVMVISPGGTVYKSKRSMLARNLAAAKKKRRRANPFAALNNSLVR